MKRTFQESASKLSYVSLDEIPPEVWKTRKFNDFLLRNCNVVYNQNIMERCTKGCIHPFPKEGDLGIAKNYQSITLTSIAAKFYNALLLNCIKPENENILRKNQNDFRRNRSIISQILTVHQIIGVHAKNLKVTLVFRFLQSIWFYTQRKDGANTSSLWSPKRNCHSHNHAL